MRFALKEYKIQLSEEGNWDGKCKLDQKFQHMYCYLFAGVIASKLGPGSNPESHLRGALLREGIIVFLKVLKVRILPEHTETWFL